MSLLLQTVTSRASDLPGGYGVALLQTLLALAAVCILAWVVLRWSARSGFGIGQGQRIRLVERVALDARRTAFLVEVGGKLYFLAAGDGGSPALIAALDSKDVPEPERKKTFLEALRGGAAATTPPAAPPALSDPAAPARERASTVAVADPDESAARAGEVRVADARDSRDDAGAA